MKDLIKIGDEQFSLEDNLSLHSITARPYDQYLAFNLNNEKTNSTFRIGVTNFSDEYNVTWKILDRESLKELSTFDKVIDYYKNTICVYG